jgi:hypothetical protein
MDPAETNQEPSERAALRERVLLWRVRMIDLNLRTQCIL